MILVTGAGGKTGRALLKMLSKKESVCAFVRHEEQISIAKSLGAARVIAGDLRDEMAVRAALEGVRAVYHICPNMNPDEVIIGRLVVEQVRNAGIEHLVYHSVLHPQTEKMTHHWQKLRVEEMIFESRLPFTILQPAPYMQNLLAGWKSILEDGILRIPYSVHARFSFVDLEDVAQAAAVVLTEPHHLNAIYELAGTLPMSHVDVARMFGQVLQREIRAETEEIGNWRSRASVMSKYAMDSLVRMFAYYDQWGLTGNTNVLSWLLRRGPTSVQLFIERTMQERNIIS